MRDFNGEVNFDKKDLPVEAIGEDVGTAFAHMLCVCLCQELDCECQVPVSEVSQSLAGCMASEHETVKFYTRK